MVEELLDKVDSDLKDIWGSLSKSVSSSVNDLWAYLKASIPKYVGVIIMKLTDI